MELTLMPATSRDLITPSASLADGLALGFASPAEAAATLAGALSDFERLAGPVDWGSFWAAPPGGAVVGFCGFKGAPDADGAVEIGYLTFPLLERRGVATAMARTMIAAAGARGAALMRAHTLPAGSGSTTVLRRLGFAFAGDVVDAEDGPVWRWELRLERV